MRFLIQLLVSAIAVMLASYLLPGVHVDSALDALLVAAVLSFLNAIVKPIMIILTIPVTIFSFGLFLFVINALMIILTDKLVDGLEVRSFWWALLFSFLLGLITSIIEGFQRSNHPEGN